MENESGGFFYLPIGHLPPVIAATLLFLARERIDAGARFAGHRRAIQIPAACRSRLEMLAQRLGPKPRTRVL